MSFMGLLMTLSLPAQSLYPLPPGWVNPRDGLRLAERGRHGMVVSADELASRIGVDVLKSGGNAVDASVAVAFALAVLLPDAGNLGGGGMMLICRLQQNGWREFYNGKLAREIVADLRAQGSLLTPDDWSSYQPLSAAPLVGSYRDTR
jgi:gamma-glutamyltranspeptidase